MRGLLMVSLVVGSTGCNAILSIPDQVELLCESGDQCAGGFCGEDFVCDDRQWAIALGDDRDQEVCDVAWYDPDREGEQPGVLMVAGRFRGTLALDPDRELTADGWDGYVMAFEPTGQVVWAQTVEGSGDQEVTAIAVGDEGAIFIAGMLGGDAELGGKSLDTSADREDGFIARLDYEDGHVQWAERFGGTDVLTVEDLAVVEQSTVIVGTYQGPFRSGPPGGAVDIGPQDAGYLVSFNGEGTNSTSSAFGSTEGLRACCVLVDPLTGSLMIGGDFDGDLSLGGGTLTSSDLPGYIIVVEEPGVEGGPLSLIGLGQPLDAFGTDSLSRLAIGLRTGDTPGVGVYRLLANQVVEAVRAETSGGAQLVDLTNNRQNATLALGTFTDTLEVVEGPSFEAQEQDLFVLTIDEDWRVPPGRSWAFGGPGRVTPVGIEADDDGHVMLVGSFDEQITFGNDAGSVTLESQGGTDIFVAQLRL